MNNESIFREAWKYQSTEPFLEALKDFAPASKYAKTIALPKEVLDFASDADAALFFYNGVLHSESKAVDRSNLKVTSNPENVIMRQIDRELNLNLQGLSDLDQNRITSGVEVRVGKSAQGSQKIVVIFVYGNQIDVQIQKKFSIATLNSYLIEEGASAEIFEAHIGVNDISYLTQQNNLYVAEENSQLKIAQAFWLGQEPILLNDTQVDLKKNSHVEYFNLNFGGLHDRNELKFNLIDQGANLKLLSLAKTKDRQIVNLSTTVNHLAALTTSRQVVKNIIADESEVIFTGRLKIERLAQKSDASQHCYNLLLDSKSIANCQPQLEVLADDVKAAHGATVGRVQEDEIFYLQSRGISRLDAELILSNAFQNEILGQINSPFLAKNINLILEGHST